MNKKITIAGAGLVGSLEAIYMAKEATKYLFTSEDPICDKLS